jgi:CheY-like chemotaxis protein
MDDEEGVRHGVGAMLRRMGHEVELTQDGQKAIDAYRSARELGRPFDAVLLDLTVRGGMGGQQAIRTLRKLDPAVRAVVMSGYADDPVILDHQHHGFAEALTKPFELAALKETVARLLGSAVSSPRTP